MTMYVGVHPNNTVKFFRGIDFEQKPHIISDEPTQRGWKASKLYETEGYLGIITSCTYCILICSQMQRHCPVIQSIGKRGETRSHMS